MYSLFEKKYVKYLTVYKTPVGPNQLDPNVFPVPMEGQEPKLMPNIHSQITRDLEIFVGGQPERIKSYYLVGSACNPGTKDRNGDLRVIVVLNNDLKDVDLDGLFAERILKIAKELSGKLATGTGRKINYVITVRPIDKNRYNGIYEIPKFSWLKVPSGITK
jgi:hypothetical protein